MLIDAANVPSGSTFRADAVVIGSGPAGITVAEALISSGRTVLVVEAAGRHHTRHDDRALSGESSEQPFPLVAARHRGFGGTSTHWTQATGLRVRPLDHADFDVRPGRPNASWPFGRDTLAPYYDHALATLGLSPEDSPQRWFGTDSPTPLIWHGGPELAMFQFADHDCFTRRFDSMANHDRLDLVLGGAVRSIQLGEDGRTAIAATVASHVGGRFDVNAPVFVAACGAIDNARLLLASSGATGHGLGNEHDNVGRFFMDHLSVDSGVIEPAADRPVNVEVFGERRQADGRSQPMLWLGDERITREGLPNAAFWIDALEPAYLSAGVGAARSARAAMRCIPHRGVASHLVRTARHPRQLLGYGVRRLVPRLRQAPVLSLRILTEQVPVRNSRIQLSSRRDDYGIPLADLHWRISSDDLNVVVEHQRVLGGLLAERGVAHLLEPFDPSRHPSPVMTNYHHLGGTRMHDDPRHGVVDRFGRIHSTTNVYVVGGSTFPTGGYLNPTLTIVALALRTAEAVSRRIDS